MTLLLSRRPEVAVASCRVAPGRPRRNVAGAGTRRAESASSRAPRASIEDRARVAVSPESGAQIMKISIRFAFGVGRSRRLNMSAPHSGSALWPRLFGILLRLGSLVAFQDAACAQQPYASGDGYKELRQSLLAKGWKPDASYGLKTASGKALYRFPEIVCGPTLCNARWRDRDGGAHLISLLRGDGKEDYRVAP
jgi:hypothetical protein